MKTFWQRWWITNRLHAYTFIAGTNIGPVVWIEKEKFIDYCRSLMTDKTKMVGGSMYVIRQPYKWLSELPHDLMIDSFLRNLIDECTDPKDDVNYIVSENRTTNRNSLETTDSLRLSAKGREVYAWSYIFFGHPYAKTIWTGVVVAVVGWFLISLLEDALTDPVLATPIEIRLYQNDELIYEQKD